MSARVTSHEKKKEREKEEEEEILFPSIGKSDFHADKLSGDAGLPLVGDLLKG